MKIIALITGLIFTTILTTNAQLPETAVNISPLLISEKIPAVKIATIDGDSVTITDIVKKQATVLLFYRGGWCPYCDAHLNAVGEIEQEIIALGYQVIAISPDSPEYLRASIDKNKLNYILYSDSKGDLSQAMGIAFKAPDKYGKKLSNFSDAQNPGILPVPSLFVIDSDGAILFEYISPDYKYRIRAQLILEVLKDLNRDWD